MVNTSPLIGRSGKRRQLIVVLPQDLESRLRLAHSIVMELNFLRHYLKMKLFRIAAFPSANLISPKKWATIGWGLLSQFMIGLYLLEGLTCTCFYIYSPWSSVNCNLLQAMQGDDHKWIWHCEYHPDINHLDITSHW